MIKPLMVMILATLAFWLALVFPVCYFLGELSAIMFSGTAAVICLLPTTVTLAWALLAFRSQPEQQFLAVLGGTGVRLVFVIGMAMALYQLVPAFQYQRFWLWVVGFYLLTLILEMVLLTRHTAVQQVHKS